MNDRAPTATSMTTPISIPICRMGTRPMIIIMTRTAPSSTAVEKFSFAISTMKMAEVHNTYLKAFLSAPLSVCMALNICAVASTSVPFAISEGWNCMPKKLIQRCAPFVALPATTTHTKVTSEMMSRKGVSSLK